MTAQAPKTQDEEILALMALDQQLGSGLPLPEALRATIAEYPAQAVSITDYAGQLSVMGESGLITSPKSAATSGSLIGLIDKIAQAKLQSRNIDEITSLISQAERVAGSSSQLAEALSIGHSVLLKLDRRLIQLSTIPAAFLEALAQQLKVSRTSLNAYLNLPPRLALSADYNSRRRPVAVMQTFDQAMDAPLATGETIADPSRWRATPKS